MKTAMNTTPARSRMLRHGAAVLLIAGLAAGPVSAVNPPTAVTTPDPAPRSMTAVEVDPYLAYLESLDNRDAISRERSVTLRDLLSARERLVREFARAHPETRTEIARALDRIVQPIDAAESALEESVAASEPAGTARLAPAPTADLERLRALARRTKKAVYLPVPPTPVMPALSAPTRESLYLDYLAVRAGESAFARGLLEDVGRMLHQRRELAYRHVAGRADDHRALEAAIAAVSERLRASTHAVAAGARVSNW